MKRICIMALLPLLILTGCTTISSCEQEDISELRDPITLTFLAIDSESPEKIDSETEVILCAENPSPFTLEADTQGNYNILQEGQQVGWIFLIQDNEGTYFKKCQTLGDNAFVGEITDLSDQIGKECVRNTIFYPDDKNTGEPSKVITDFYIVKIGSYSLKIQASEIPIEEADAFQENFLPFFKTISIQE